MIQWIRIFPEISIDVIFENIVRTMQRDKKDVTYDCDILFTFYGQILCVIAGKNSSHLYLHRSDTYSKTKISRLIFILYMIMFAFI